MSHSIQDDRNGSTNGNTNGNINGNTNGNAYSPASQSTNAYLVGGGIASLAAAVFLIHDAHVPASQIHILESSKLMGGSMDGGGSPSTGYILRGGRMLNLSYLCLYDLLKPIPSLTDPKLSVMDEIRAFNAIEGNKTHANARIVTEKTHLPDQAAPPPVIADSTWYGLSGKERVDLTRMMVQDEHRLGRQTIEEYFDKGFFETNFWYMWATMFAFQRWHSAVEFRRYLHRFIQELPRLHTLEGVDRTPYNQYDSIIKPIATYLRNQGVNFQYDTTVRSLSYANAKSPSLSAAKITVEEIHILEGNITGVINVHENDVVLITLGSMTSSSSIGSNTTAPAVPSPHPLPKFTDPSWALWDSLSNDNTLFGNPHNFSSRAPESNWESFTVTLKSPEFFSHLSEMTNNLPGTGALVTFKDSSWLMSIVVPHQPHFIDQPEDVQVFWGYGLFPAREGDFVKKPMAACTGEEIFTELLGHLHFPVHPTVEDATTIPCFMPYITSQFLTRSPGDRPHVIPEGSTNLAFMGQFVEIPDDVVFTVEYSVRGAKMAVSGLMEEAKNKKPKPVFKGERNPKVLAKALEVMVEDGVDQFKARAMPFAPHAWV